MNKMQRGRYAVRHILNEMRETTMTNDALMTLSEKLVAQLGREAAINELLDCAILWEFNIASDAPHDEAWSIDRLIEKLKAKSEQLRALKY
jgi:hypothetical protein